jgi:hypothetical protein
MYMVLHSINFQTILLTQIYTMRNFIYLFVMSFLFVTLEVAAQSPLRFGVNGGIQLNSAILPDIELNESIDDVLDGNEVVKGVPQYAQVTINYRIGGFVHFEDGIGFTQLDVDYATAHIFKELTMDAGFLGDYTVTALDRKYSYLDTHLSYNIYLSEHHTAFVGLGGGPSFLLSYSNNNEPEPINWNAFLNLGVALNEHISLQTKLQLGINEVYKDSYVHHLMVPIIVNYSF